MGTPLINRIPDSYEVRSFTDDLRADPEVGSFTGHASNFWNVDSYGTAMAPKAFRKTIADKGDRIPVLFFHEPKEMVGPARVLREDGQGLYHESVAVDDKQTGSYVLAHMRAGTPMGMSFGFRTVSDRPGTKDDPIDFTTAPEGLSAENPTDMRVITEVELYEISVLPWTFAANSKADITSVRSVADAATLSQLLEDLRSGDIAEGDARWTLLQQLVAAFTETQPEPLADASTPLPDAEARRRNLYAEYQLLVATS